MQQSTGQFFVDEEFKTDVTDKAFRNLKEKGLLTVLHNSNEISKQILEDIVPVDNLPDPDCLVCSGKGSLVVKNSLVLKFTPCPCTSKEV